MKEYYLKYRYKTFFTLYEWKQKSYIAKDKNDLIEKINELIRNHVTIYIINIEEMEKKEND